MQTFKRKKKGGEGTLNSHIENYIKAEKDDDQKAMDQHKTLYMNAYARHMGVPKMIQKKLAFGLIPSRNVINPKIQASFDKRVEDEKNAQKDADELEQKRQEEIIKRNLREDRIKQMNRKNMERSGAFRPENVTPQTKKAASNRFIQMRKDAQARGPSTLRNQSRGGKRKTRKYRKKHKKKTRKNKNKNKKKTRKHKKRTKRGGMQRRRRGRGEEPVGNSSLRRIIQDGNPYVIKIDQSGKPIRDTNGYIILYDYKNAINYKRLIPKGIMKESNPQEGAGKNKKRRY